MIKAPLQYCISDFSGKNISIKHKLVEGDFRLHWHQCCEIEFILAGKGSQLLNNTRYDMSPGTLYMLTPADCHSIEVVEPIEIVGIMFEDKLISRTIYERLLTFETLGLNLNARLEGQSLAAVNGFFSALLGEDRLFATDTSENTFGDLYVSHLIDCILIELLRSCPGHRTGSINLRSERRYCISTVITPRR